MTTQDILAELEQMGTEQNRKIYQRHGISEPLYGVSFANLKTLKKAVKRDHECVQALWATGNHDARILATMIADPKQADPALLEDWIRDVDNYCLTDTLTGYISKTAWSRTMMDAWITSEEEWIGRAGWQLLARCALQDTTLPDTFFASYLDEIERTIHTSKNRVRDAKNSALIAIGMRNDALEAQALATAERIGKVEVDHGQTSCKTPDATAYIVKSRKRRQAKAPA